jgi:hypothetical protein
MMGNSLHEYATSDNYGWFKLADNTTGIKSINNLPVLNAWYNSSNREIKIQNTSVRTVRLYNVTGQAVNVKYDNGIVPVSHLKAGIYILSAMDTTGKFVGSKKIVLY